MGENSRFLPTVEMTEKVEMTYNRYYSNISYSTGGFIMAKVNKKKGVIGILTGGGDVPGLNPAIRAVTIRAIREGYQVIGIRHGWEGTIQIIPD
jgi:hypothetical protein